MRVNFGKKSLAFLLAALICAASPAVVQAASNTDTDINAAKAADETIDTQDRGVSSDADAASEVPADATGTHRVSLVDQGDPDEVIKVIVELDSTGVVSNGKKKASSSLRNKHKNVQNAIRDLITADEDASGQNGSNVHLQSNDDAADPEDAVTVLYDYYEIMDGFAVEVPRKYLADIQTLSGVRTAFEAQTVYPFADEGEATSLQNAGTLKTVGADSSAYTGAGQVIAILDTGLYTNHEAFKGEVPELAITQADIGGKISRMTIKDKGVTANSLYISNKIPFAYDYADKDTNVNPGSIADISHGTHVAGIAAANNGDVIRGMAPDAQLLIMKTFSDAGAGDDTNILAAAEDAVILGADVINMSLGSDAGFDSNRAEVYTRVYNNIQERGIFLSAAAGNSYAATYNTSNTTDYAAVTNPDYGILVDPSTYAAAISVASSDSASEEYYFIASDQNHTKIIYEEADGGTRPRMSSLEGTYPYIDCGYGTTQDVQTALLELGADDFSGYIAVIRRGKSETAPEEEEVLTFSAKISNAAEKGAAAVIICDNVEKNTLTVMGGVTQTKVPSVFISKVDGDRLLNAEKKTIVIDADYKQGAPARLSSFSSWGVTPEMKLKPEIAAPGGTIYSSIPDNKYGYKSGTSMATPAIAGLAADAKQYVTSDPKFASFTDEQKNELVPLLLMNTAVPVPYEKDSYYSPRKQGAGVANLAALEGAKAYLTIQGAAFSRPKAELGDGTGPYTATFTIHNLTDEPLHYKIDTAALSEVIRKGYFQQYSLNYAGKGIRVDYSGITDGGVDIPASGTADVSVTLTPQDEFLSDVAAATNGTFIDGYVMLKAASGSGSDLSFPFIAFYGSWGAAPVIDGVLHVGDDEAAYMRGCEAYSPSLYNYNLGDNNFNGDIDLNPLHYAFSKNSKGGVFASISTITGLLRPASEMHYVMKLKSTGEIVNRYDYYNVRRSYYAPEAGMVTYAEAFLSDQGGAPVFGTTTQNHKELTDGVYTVEISATSCGPHAATTSWSFDITYDTQKPRVDSSEITGEEGDQTLTIHVSDNHYVSALRVVYGKDDTALETRTFDFEDYKEEGRSCYDVTFDYEDLIEKLKSRTGEEPENMKILLYDYAMNEASQTVVLKDIYPEGITLNEASLELVQGREAVLHAELTPENVTKDQIVWSSSNESVATVDENGVVTATGEGSARITAQSETESVKASCDVKVTALTDEQGILLNRAEVTLTMGETEPLHAVLSQEMQGKTVTWTSGNEEIAAVDENGIVTAVSTGVTHVTASIEADGKTFSDTCKIAVRPQASDDFIIDENGVLQDYVGWSSQITIPEGVTSIAKGAFAKKQVTDVVIPASCAAIEEEAFRECTGLTTVSFANASSGKCTSVGDRAFDGCVSLRSVTFPTSLETIGEAALRNTDLRTLNLPKKVSEVPNELCSGCRNLTSIKFNGDITAIGASAFSDCGMKNTLKLPETVVSIGDSAFENVPVTAFTAPAALQSIGARAFYNTKLANAQPVLNEGLTSIGEEAFSGTAIKSFTFPDSVTEVGTRVLADCRNLKTVSIGKSISNLTEPTVNTPALEEFTVSADNRKLETVDKALYTGKTTAGGRTLIAYPAASIKESSVELPSDVTTIAPSAFRGMTNLANLTFEQPSNLTAIGADAFNGCGRLSSVDLPDSMTMLGDRAFADCKAAAGLQIGAGLTEIGSDAFRGMDALAVITVSADNTVLSSENDVLYDKDQTELIRYAPKKTETEYTAPETLKKIGSRAFYSAEALERAAFSEGVEEIGAEAFAGAGSLALLELPDSVVSVGERAFTGTKTDILCLGSHLKQIGSEALGNLNAKHIVVEGDGVSVKYSPGLNSLETLYLGDGVTAIEDAIGVFAPDSIVLGANLEKVNKNAFNLLRKGTFYIEKGTTTWDTMSSLIKELQRRRGSSNIRLEAYVPLALTVSTVEGGTLGKAAVSGGIGGNEFRFTQVNADGSKLTLCDWSEKDTIGLEGLPEDSLLRVEARDATKRCVSAELNLQDGESLPGDVNGDGQVDARDLTTLSRHLHHKQLITDSKLLNNADVTQDGRVDEQDLKRLAAYIARIIRTLE